MHGADEETSPSKMAAVGVGAGELLWHLCDARAVAEALASHFGREYDDAVAYLARGCIDGRRKLLIMFV